MLPWRSDEGTQLRYDPGPDRPSLQIKFIKDNGIESETLSVTNIMDELYVCIRRNICDPNLAITILERDIENAYTRSRYFLSEYKGRMGGEPGCGLTALYAAAHAQLKALRGWGVDCIYDDEGTC